MSADTEIDERIGAPDCDCGHSTMRHHGSDRSGRGFMVYSLRSEFTGCKDCSWCDYYKPRFPDPVSSTEGESK